MEEESRGAVGGIREDRGWLRTRMGVQRPIRERGGRHVRTDDAEGGSLMSRRVPRTLRTLKLDYREIAALLPAPPFSQPPCSLPARLPPSPSSSSSSTTAFSLLASPLRPPQTSSSSTFPATSFPESFSPLVRIGCIATDGRTYLVGSFTCVANSGVLRSWRLFSSSSFRPEICPFRTDLSRSPPLLFLFLFRSALFIALLSFLFTVAFTLTALRSLLVSFESYISVRIFFFSFCSFLYSIVATIIFFISLFKYFLGSFLFLFLSDCSSRVFISRALFFPLAFFILASMVTHTGACVRRVRGTVRV